MVTSNIVYRAASLTDSGVDTFRRSSVTVSNELRAVVFDRLVLTFDDVKREAAPRVSVIAVTMVRLVERGSSAWRGICRDVCEVCGDTFCPWLTKQ